MSTGVNALKVQAVQHSVDSINLSGEIFDVHSKTANLIELAASVCICNHFGYEELLLFQYDQPLPKGLFFGFQYRNRAAGVTSETGIAATSSKIAVFYRRKSGSLPSRATE